TPEQIEKPISLVFHSWSYVRDAIMASYNYSKKVNPIWSRPLNEGLSGSCRCLEFTKNGHCYHTEQLKLWAKKKFNLSQVSLGKRFEQSQWIGLGQKWFQDWGALNPKVKLPSVLQFFDEKGRLRVEFKSRNLGQILTDDFYGLLIHLDPECFRRLRIDQKVEPLTWEHFYQQNLDRTELNLRTQSMSTPGMLFENSMIGAIMRHGCVLFQEGDSPSQLHLEKNGFSVTFHP
ncbi:MAG: hypothetical protein P8R38_00625, partial [Planctomycetota bacterium]|nr:hypothetical protein [Planctomycetota bacterium]